MTPSEDAVEVRSVLAEMLRRSFSDVIAPTHREETLETAAATEGPLKSPAKARSLSDSTPQLSPSPKIKEIPRKSKDDNTLNPQQSQHPTPRTPRRPDFLAKGLSLQMPPRDAVCSTPSPTSAGFRAPPLSPRLEKRDIYGSPAASLPRHSRGLDFARACTNLHHSTLAESSPDASPTITQKSVIIPPRKMSVSTMMLDSPAFGQWAQVPNSERSVMSSSLGSVKMMSDSSSDSGDELDSLDVDDGEDPIVNTPQMMKRHNPSATTPFNAPGAWGSAFAPSGTSFQHFHRQRLRNGRSRKSSSSASGHSALASPIPQSPPLNKVNSDGYFPRDAAMRGPASRRESLSLHTHDLHISSGNDSGDEANKPSLTTPGVIRRAVTRRGNLLPKTRAFGRIRAELLEETMPVDTEVKREAEVIRQVRDEAPDHHRDSITANSSPTMQAVDSLTEALQGIPEYAQLPMEELSSNKGLFGGPARQSSSANVGKDFWGSLHAANRHSTPPPPPSLARFSSSSMMSDDVSMALDSPTVSTPTGSVFPWAMPSKEFPMSNQQNGTNMDSSRASTPQPATATATPSGAMVPPTAAEGIRKANKRRRDDDLDLASMKRRAVSPGVSVGNSPILSQSPSQRSDAWGQPAGPLKSAGSSGSGGGGGGAAAAAGSAVVVGEKAERGSHGNAAVGVSHTPVLGPKRVGLQGMNDMQGMTEKMSIE